MRIRLWGAALMSVCAVALSGASAGSAVAAPVKPAAPQQVNSRFLDSTVINAVPTFGGISGMDRTGNGTYVFLSTDVGRFGPARFFTGTVPFNSAVGFLGQPSITGGGTVLRPGVLPMLPGSAQFEGIRRLSSGYVVVSGGAHQFVQTIGDLGNQIRDLPLPPAYRPSAKSGLVGQRGLTGVAVAPGDRISVLTAGGLEQDPPNAARLLTWAGRGTSEFVYRTDPDKVAADVLTVNNTDYLVLERGRGRVTRIYWTTTRGAQPVTGVARLNGRERAMPKRQIFTTDPLVALDTGNMSGLSWGNWLPDRPWLAYRSRVLFVVANNAFAGPTRIHALEIRFPKN